MTEPTYSQSVAALEAITVESVQQLVDTRAKLAGAEARVAELEAELEQLRRLVPSAAPDSEYTEHQVVGDWGVDGAADADEARRRVRESLTAYPHCGARAEQRTVRIWEDVDGEAELYGPWRPIGAELEQPRTERSA